MNTGALVYLNGTEVPAYVVEREGGLRMRLDLIDWERVVRNCN